MGVVQQILVPVDFSIHCQNAAPHIAALASRLNAQLDLLYVVDTVRNSYASLDTAQATSSERHSTNQWETMLCRFGHSKFAGLPFRCSIREGDVAKEIVKFASEAKCDLIAMPTLGCTHMHPFAVGSVTDAVLHTSHCPVWVTSTSKQRDPTGPLVPRVIMCAMELSDEELPMMQFAARFAAAIGARLVAFHVETRSESLVVQGGQSDWDDLRRRSGLDTDLVVSEGDVGREIQAAIVNQEADLLILGRHHLRNSVSPLKTHLYTIIGRASCPALIA